MTLIVNNIGDNPQQPGTYSEAYIPDQLIAGNMKLVTDSVTVTGAAVLQRGSLLGLAAFGAIAASAGTAFATGSIVVAGTPVANDTVTIGGTAVTFVAANPTGNQVLIGATTAATAQSLAALLIGSVDVNLIKFAYSLNGSTVTTNAAAAGTGGNALTLATSDAVAFTVSGATLSGGVANTGNATVGTMSTGVTFKTGNYTAVCVTATTANVFDPIGDQIGLATFGAQFNDAEISFKITAGGTPCVAGDTFVLAAASGGGLYKLAVSSATDGSQVPVAILADYCDPTAGNVIAPIYIEGEFNINAVQYGPGITPAAAKASMRLWNIYLKSVQTATDPS